MRFTDVSSREKRAFNRANIASVTASKRTYEYDDNGNHRIIAPFDVTVVETYTGYGWVVMEPFDQVAAWLEGNE